MRSKASIISIVLFLFAHDKGIAADGWVVILENPGSWTFINEQSIKRKGAKVRVWMRNDLKEPQRLPTGKTYQSVANFLEVDCDEEAITYLAENIYADLFGTGEVVSAKSYKNPEKYPVVPGSVGAKVQTLVCR